MAKEIGTNELIETWGSAGNVVEPSVGKITGGWTFEEQPPHEYMNWVHNKLGQQINYLMRSGIPSWNAATSYTTGSAVVHSGAIWLASGPNDNSEPSAGNTDWVGFDASLFAAAEEGVPTGAVMAFAISTPPTGWIKCNGALISRTVYAKLFSAIGTTWGSGDGSTTFKVPDFRGEFLRGWDDGRGVDTGRAFAAAQNEEIGRHRHEFRAPSGERYYVYNDKNTTPPAQDVADGAGGPTDGPNTANDAQIYPWTSYVGGENRPRNVAVQYCIKV